MVVRTFHPASVGQGKIVRTLAPVFDHASSFLTTVIDRGRPKSIGDMATAAGRDRQGETDGEGGGIRRGDEDGGGSESGRCAAGVQVQLLKLCVCVSVCVYNANVYWFAPFICLLVKLLCVCVSAYSLSYCVCVQ